MWAGKTSCSERVMYMKRTYNSGRVNAKINAMMQPTCKKQPEHERLMPLANTTFDSDKFCGECMWVGKTTCNQRVQFLERTYNTGTVDAKINTMKHPTCTKQ